MLREEIETLEQNGITRVALTRLGDPDVIPLWFGEGDLVTPAFIREAAKTALDEGYTFYGHMRGRAELRSAIKAYLDRIYDLDLDPAGITVPGSSMLAVTMAAQMTLGRGRHGLIVSPHWPNIDRAYAVTGAEFDCVRQRSTAQGWTLDLDDVRAAIRPETTALFVNTPCNPTGWIMDVDAQRALLDLCREHGIVIIADEVYHRTVYDATVAPSFLQVAGPDDPVIVINGFSKAFAMTGWRLGWMITPSRFAQQMAVLSECFNTSAPSFIQRAGLAALEQEGETTIGTLREAYRRGRECVDRVLGEHPLFDMAPLEGAFYAFPRVPGMRTTSLEFVEGVLAEENVGLAPGYTFGPGNEQYFRLCYAQSLERLEEALSRVIRYVERHAAG